MKSALAKMFLLALPLAGVLMTAPAAQAHWQHYHHHCRPYAEHGWYNKGGRYDNGYYSRQGWYEDHRHRYGDGDDDDYYPSRYPLRRYDGNGHPWWSAWSYR